MGADMISIHTVARWRLGITSLTATRTSEVRFSKWADFDLDAKCWVIPAEQTGRKGKGDKRKEHAVPLENQTAAAYVRTSYFEEERRGIMQQWADYLDKVEAGAQVIPLRA
jgi:integrase